MESLVAWRRWRTWMRATMSADTVRTYSGNVLRFLAETDCLDLEDYTEQECSLFFSGEGWVERGRAKYDYAKAITNFFRYWHRKGAIPADPMGDLRLRKPRRVKQPALTEDELRRVLFAAAALLGERQAWCLLLTYLLGLRRMEAAGLRWDDVRDGDEGPEIEIHVTKGATERPALPLPALALECLARIRELPVPGQVRRGPAYIMRVQRATISEWTHTAATAAGLDPPESRGASTPGEPRYQRPQGWRRHSDRPADARAPQSRVDQLVRSRSGGC